jgi:hypothetical protein
LLIGVLRVGVRVLSLASRRFEVNGLTSDLYVPMV